METLAMDVERFLRILSQEPGIVELSFNPNAKSGLKRYSIISARFLLCSTIDLFIIVFKLQIVTAGNGKPVK